MSNKHTPGPWVRLESVGAKHSLIRDSGKDGTGYLIATLSRTKTRQIESDANARLIAAAPELLEVAKKVLAMQAAMKEEVDAMPRSYEAPKTVDAIGVVIEWARQAIAKAAGEEK